MLFRDSFSFLVATCGANQAWIVVCLVPVAYIPDKAAAILKRNLRLEKGNTPLAAAAGRLADFKTPRRILILDEIPKGPTGKLQRIGLAA
jgi:acyl-coenzyme A synthetase/AMP-(fatty) acid ligase